jgi:phosphoribosylglycinamide formyltransferase-1
MIRLGVLGSTNGTDLQTILDSIASGELIGEVSVVLSNQKNAYILVRAKNHNVPTVFLSHKEKSREEFDAEMTAILKEHAVDLVLLIGFMRILSTKFCQEWRDRIRIKPMRSTRSTACSFKIAVISASNSSRDFSL